MPWCPKCKSEYREKFTVCPRCGCELVKAAPLHRMEQRSDFVSGSAGPGDNPGLRKSCAAAVKPWQKENFGCHFTVWVTLFLGSLGMAGISLCIFFGMRRFLSFLRRCIRCLYSVYYLWIYVPEKSSDL